MLAPEQNIKPGDIIETRVELIRTGSFPFPDVKISQGTRGIVEEINGAFLRISFEKGSNSTMKAEISEYSVRKVD